MAHLNKTLFITGSLCGSIAVAAASKSDKPNILLVLSDDHSAFATSSYGNPDVQTPNLNRLAAEGVQFERAYATSPQSVPARASIFTGRSPVAVNMTRFNVPLARRFRAFPEYLRENGYYTGVAGRGYHMDGSVSGKIGKVKEAEEYYIAKGLKTFPERLDTCMVVPDARKGKSHWKINRQFRQFMENRDKEKPFFLQLCYSDPHTPYDAEKVHNPANLRLREYYPDTPGVREHLGAYYDEISRMDSDFGEVLKYLDDNGLYDNTIVIFMGDNGGAQLRAKGTLYEDGIRVPFIIRWPGHIKGGSKINSLVSNVDIAPTALAAACISVPEDMEGINLIPAMTQGSSLPERCVFSVRSCHATNELPWTTAQFDQQRCIISGRYKLIYNLLPDLKYTPIDFHHYPFYLELEKMNQDGTLATAFSEMYFSSRRPMFELFDLEKDPAELNNLINNPEYKDIRDGLIVSLTYKMIDDEDFATLPLPKKYDITM
jgi:hypothetical protein